MLPAVLRRQTSGDDVILFVQGVSKSFGGLKAVQNVSFEVLRGEILGIIGPNGAGKTTLFNLLNGFLRPDQGRVLLDGTDMVGRKPHQLCHAGVGRTFQVMRPFLRMSVADNVVVGAYVHAGTDEEARRRADEAIEMVGLSDVAHRLGGELTTKQLRLMELARALAGQPRLLLLDETLAGLGHTEVGDVLAVIRKLAEQRHHHRDYRAHDGSDGAASRPVCRARPWHGPGPGRAQGGHERPARDRGISGQEVERPC